MVSEVVWLGLEVPTKAHAKHGSFFNDFTNRLFEQTVLIAIELSSTSSQMPRLESQLHGWLFDLVAWLDLNILAR